jgi:hypothetical protein
VIGSTGSVEVGGVSAESTTAAPVTTGGGAAPTGGTLPLISQTHAGAGAGVSGANATGATHLAQTGSSPLEAEGALGTILALIGVALLKPRQFVRRIFG